METGSMAEPPIDYDVVIAGGGMVGMALACALGSTSLRVAVLESGEPPCLPGQDYDLRVSAISSASCVLFEALAVWQAIKVFRVSPIDEMHIWDAGGSASLHFDAADIGAANLGYIIENNVVLAMLHQKMGQHNNINYVPGTRLEHIQHQPSCVDITTNTGKSWRTRLLVGADGAQSRVRQLLNIDTRGFEFGQQAIVATVTTEKPHQYTAWQRFLPTGPLAFLPLKNAHQCSIVWSVESGCADQLLALADDTFMAELEAAFEMRLGRIEAISKRQAFVLTLAHAQHYVQQRTVLIGDAAHRMHPLAGQGVNMGLADVAVLAQVILDASTEHKDLGGSRVLRKYERWRKGDNTAMLMATAGFKQLFSNDRPLLRSVRNSGIAMVNRVQPLKNRFMRLASGLESELPEWIKGVSFIP